MRLNDPRELSREEELERQLADLKARLPAHSVPSSMMIELDELEEQLAKIRAKTDEEKQSQ
jgi:hypothetical protein